MNKFKIIPTIEKYSTVKEMLAVESFTQEDLILTSKSSYEKYFQGKTNTADVIYKGDFGNGEPTEVMMDKIIKTIDYKKYQRIIAIGGGGVIDMAKVLLIAQGRPVEKIIEGGVLSKPKCSLIAIPTTCGSGSEMSNIAILGMEKIQSKLGLVYDELYPNRSIIIPELLENLPDRFFLTSAIDGMIHGIESYLSPKNNSYTELFSLKGLKLYMKGLKKIADHGIKIKDTLFDDFSLASNYTGIAFSNTGTGAVHAISYPLSGKYHVTHGEANALFLVEILKLYREKNKGE
ncbi:MAG: iron-containing alcohol dehydrogenase, partial [Anaerovoracaceae bacterium]